MEQTQILPTENELVIALKNSEPEAYSQLYKDYSIALYAYTLKYISEDKAHQVVEDIFILILKMIDVYDEAKGTFLTWIMKITRLHVNSVASNNSFNVIPNLTTGSVLSDDEQLIFLLIYYQGHTTETVSKAMGMSHSEVSALFTAAIIQLNLI